VFSHQRPGIRADGSHAQPKHNRVLHERNIILTIRATDTPPRATSRTVEVEQISGRFLSALQRITASWNAECAEDFLTLPAQGFECRFPGDVLLPVARSLRAAPKTTMPRWQERLFISPHDAGSVGIFKIPPSGLRRRR